MAAAPAADEPRQRAARARRARRRRTTTPPRRTGEPSCAGVDAELLAGVGLERELGVAHHRLGQLAGPRSGVDAPRLGRCRPARRSRRRVAGAARRARSRSSRSSSSAWTRIELYSPAAIEIAPATSPASPASRTTAGAGSAPATPRISPTFDTSPSLTPNTAARAAPPWTSRWWCSGWTDGTWGDHARNGIHRRRRGRTLGQRALPLRPRPRRARRAARPASRATASTRCGTASTASWPRPAELTDAAQGAARPARRRGSRRPSTPVAESTERRRRHREVAVALDGGARVETVLMHYPDRTTVCVSTQAGCAMALRVLRHRPGRVRAPPHDRRDRRAGRAGRPPVPRRRPPPRQRRVHGHGRAARQLRPRVGRGRAPARRPRPVGPPPHASRRSASSPASAGWPTSDLPVNLAVSLHAANDDAARRARADQPALPARRCSMAACADYLRGQGPAAVVRVGADRRHQRPRPSTPRELAELCPALPLPAHVNLIPLNPTPGYPTRGTPPDGRARASATGSTTSASTPPSAATGAPTSTPPAASCAARVELRAAARPTGLSAPAR